MKRLSSIALFVVISLLFAAGCQQPARDKTDQTIVETPDKEAEAVTDQSMDVVEQKPDETMTQETQTEATDVTVVETKEPKIMVEKVVHDFGEMGPGTKQKCTFPYKNIGDTILNLEVETTCGCTIADVNTPLNPGESGKVTVEYHAQVVPGNVRKALYLKTNDKEIPKMTLTIKAKVVKRVDYEPESLKFFLGEENAGVQEITLTSLDDRPFSITGFTSTADCIIAEFDPAVKATKFVLKAKVDGEKLKSNLRGRVSIGLTHPECKNVTIFFDVLPKYTVNPPMIIIFDAEPLKPITRKLWILSNYKKAFEVEGVISKDNSVKVLEKSEIHNGFAFMLEITPPDAEGRINFNGEFSLKIKDGQELPVVYRVFYKESDSEEEVAEEAEEGS